MGWIANILVGLIALLHVYICWLEMFAWERRGPKVFRGLDRDLFARTVSMAGNQGLYNGFLAAGLIWSLLIGDPVWARQIATFFVGCVALAGIYGAVTVSRRILFVQTVPAAAALLAIWIS